MYVQYRTDAQAADTDNVFRNRWRALMSVDDGIAGIVSAVEELGLSNSTYFFVTSDRATAPDNVC